MSVAVDKKKVFVRLVDPPVPSKIKARDLFDHFNRFSDLKGKIEKVDLMSQSVASRKMAPHGFVQFTTSDAAREAIKYNGTVLAGVCKIRVKPFSPPSKEGISSRAKRGSYLHVSAYEETSSDTRTHQSHPRSRIPPSCGGSSPESPGQIYRSSNQGKPLTVEQKYHPRRGRIPKLSDCSTKSQSAVSPKAPHAGIQGDQLPKPQASSGSYKPIAAQDTTTSQNKQLSTPTSPEVDWPDLVHVVLPPPIVKPASSVSSLEATAHTYIVAINNLSIQLDEDDLLPFLGSRGKLISMEVVGRGTHKRAAVSYPSSADAEEAVHKWHGRVLLGRQLSVSMASDGLSQIAPPHSHPTVTPHILSQVPPPYFNASSGLPPPPPPPPPPAVTPYMSQVPPPYFDAPSGPPPPPPATPPPPCVPHISQVPPPYFNTTGGYATPFCHPVEPPLIAQPGAGLPVPWMPSHALLQHALMHPSCMKRKVSSYFGEFLIATSTQECQRLGVTLQYSEPEGCLLIYANSPEAAGEFVTEVMEQQHTECHIPLTVKKWNQLSQLRPDKSKLFDELIEPFSTNPSVHIGLVPQYGSKKQPSVVFVGKNDAVKSAQLHFIGTLSKEVDMNRTQAAALQHFLPEIPSLCQLHVKILFADTSICFEGSSTAVTQANKEVEKQLSFLKVHPLPSSMSPSLLSSLRKRLRLEKLNACVLHFPPELPCMVTLSDEEYQRAMRVVGSICQRSHTLPSTDLVEKLQSGSGLINCLEQTHQVLTTIKDRVITVEGYIEGGVVAATETLISEINALSTTSKPLECPPTIHSYLDLVLFKQPDADTRSFLSSLPVQVTISKDNLIQLEGTPAAIDEGRKQLLSRFIPSQLKYRQFEFSCAPRFFFLIEEFVLTQMHEEMPTLRYLAPEHSSASSSSLSSSTTSSSSSPDKAGFSFTVFCSEARHFEQVCKEIQDLRPHTVEIPVHPSTIDLLDRRKRTLEQRYCVSLRIHCDPKTCISIDGLQNEHVSSCQKELEDTLTITKEVSIQGFQVVYLQNKFEQKLTELKGDCQSFDVPEVERSQKGLLGKYNIKLEGKPTNVEFTEKEIKKILNDDLKHNSVTVECQENVHSLWKERWKHVILEFEKEHVVLAWFGQTASPRVNLYNTGPYKMAAPQGKPKMVETTFLIFGKSGSVDEFSKVLQDQENGEILEKKFEIPSADVSQSLRVAISSNKVDLRNHQVIVEFPQGRCVVLQAPRFKMDDFTAANVMVENFIAKMLLRTETVACKDKLVAIILSHDHALLQKAIPSDLKEKVTMSLQMNPPAIQLSGNQPNIETMLHSIEVLVSKIQARLGTMKITLDPLLKPFFLSEEYLQLCSQLELNHQVMVKCSCPFLQHKNANKVLCQTTFQPDPNALCVQLFLIQGDILQEEVDVIVNAANPKLEHIGGLAKAIADAGGGKIQKESTCYVKDNGELSPGKAVCLSSGILPFQKIIHAVGPRWRGGYSKEQEKLHRAVYNCLCVANKENLKTIAIPALGTGVYEVPMSVCAQESQRAVVDFCRNHPRAVLNEVHFVLYSEKDSQSFIKNFGMLTSQTEVVSEASDLLFPSVQSEEDMDTKLNWLWKNDTGTFSPYDSVTGKLLTQHYQNNPHGTCTITVNRQQYTVDFATMTQTNMMTHFPRNVKLEGKKTSAQWFYRDDKRQYTAYTAHDSAAIEECYQAGSVKPVRLKINTNSYDVDTANKFQVNVVTGHKRQIKREISTSGLLQSAATHLDEEEELDDGVFSDSDHITVILRGPQEELQEAEIVLREKLLSCKKTEQMPLRRAVKSTKKALKKIAGQHGIQVTFSGKGKNCVATISGASVAFDKAFPEMMKRVIENIPEDEVENPPEWEQQSKTMELFTVQRDSPEWQAVSTKFTSTMHSVHIHSIQRIQNKWLWKRYAQHRKMMEEKNNGSVNEMELFHGTRQNDPKEIYDSEEGFDMRFSADGMWGQANYFAVNASYSDSYAHTSYGYTTLRHREMFLAKVLTGDSHDCSSRSLRMPPLKTSAEGVELSQVRYDTVTGITRGSRVYMTYDNQKAYPAYLINYY